jgi:AraC-like DNA-binding protein
MIYHNLIPSYPLNDFVDSIYYLHGNMGNEQKQILPDYKTDLIFLFDSTMTGHFETGKSITVSDSLVNGFRREPLCFRYNGRVEMLGIRFLPYGFTQLFHILPEEIRNFYQASEVVNQKTIREMEEKIFLEPVAEKKLRIIENWLLGIVRKTRIESNLAIKAIHRIATGKGVLSMTKICNNSPSEYKQLQRFCHDKMDIAPKTYSRMVRFEHLHQLMLANPENDWMSLVAQFEFTDQSHLIREIKQFTGLTPKAFKAGIHTFV